MHIGDENALKVQKNLEFSYHFQVGPQPIWIKVKKYGDKSTTASKYTTRKPRVCIIWNLFFQTKIYLVNVPLNVCVVKKDLLHKKTVFENFMKWGLKGAISNDADSGPPRYVLWCCGGICQEDFTFIQIGSGHTVGF